MVDNFPKKYFGNINAYIDQFNELAEVGILISEVGHGYSLSAWSQMLDLLLSKDGHVRKVTVGAMAEN
jgi:hypothetical protein